MLPGVRYHMAGIRDLWKEKRSKGSEVKADVNIVNPFSVCLIAAMRIIFSSKVFFFGGGHYQGSGGVACLENKSGTHLASELWTPESPPARKSNKQACRWPKALFTGY